MRKGAAMSSIEGKKPKKKKSGLLIVLIMIVVILLIAVAGLGFYNMGLKPSVERTEMKVIEIKERSTLTDVGKLFAEEGIIRSSLAFKVYTKLNKVLPVQAGRYGIAPGMSLKEILSMMEKGETYTGDQIQFTYIEGKTIPWLAKAIAEATSNTEEEVYALLKNEEYLNAIIEKYWFVTDAIKDPDIYYSLEGYLFPDTYTLENTDVSVQEIFSVMLNKMDKVLTEYKSEIDESDYSVHELLTIASVVEGESMAVQDRAGVAGVFFRRLDRGMSMGSDITTYYAIRVDPHARDLSGEDLDLEAAYSTIGPNMEGVNPVGPFCAPSRSAIEGTLHPDDSGALFFVSDKNGKLYFSETNAEHEETVEWLKEQGLWYTY